MKKFIAPLLLLPSLAFAHTNSVDFPIQAKCDSDNQVVNLSFRVTNLSNYRTTFKINFVGDSGTSQKTSVGIVNGNSTSYSSMTEDTVTSIYANSTITVQAQYIHNYTGSNSRGKNTCSLLPVMANIMHMDTNSQILVTGYTYSTDSLTSSADPKFQFDFNINNGKPF
ncbi:hypothetical protein [Vibrio quintilis]|uniref:Uncharacterized protein n=1 Tax=Vibrio quintilis TaxID=1117707 RepID=A0A1M7Z0K6_9VIBR|nr:hypothetical protein [Vibrio quintilis]SHO58345.1 hypothetical protein VQ7734_04117 [Vibrio quintilis]